MKQIKGDGSVSYVDNNLHDGMRLRDSMNQLWIEK